MPDLVRILIVDDEKNILEPFSMMLTDQGYHVRTASRAEEAVRLVAGEKFEVAFLDHFLGPSRGLELMKELSGVDPDLSFVLMTANGSTDLAVDALKRGASDFISKPFFIADMIKSIEYVNKKRALEKEKRELLAMLKRTVDEKTEELNRAHISVLSTLAQAMEKRDTGTYGHSKRVDYYSRLIAAALGLSDKERAELKTAAMLHDIGKIGITDFILGKEGRLNQREKDLVKTHPQKGVEILRPLKQLEHILPSILHHHEHFDGTGYPAGLAGENIPLYARIISVADTYDAILSTRPYRKGAAHEHAMRELQDFAGRQFDPEIVRAFVEADSRYQLAMDPMAAVPASTLGGRAIGRIG